MLNAADVLPLLEKNRVPGVQMGVVAAGQPGAVLCVGQVAWDGAPVTPQTVFHTASLSKPVAALAVLQLVERGLLPLDADVTPWLQYDLPWHHFVAERMRKAPAPVTVRWLLQHRSGVIGRGTTPNRANDAFLPLPHGGGSLRFERQPGAYVPSLGEMWHGWQGDHPFMLTAMPGEQYAYSGVGYTILQHIVEQITGTTFAKYMNDEVFPALGASRSTYELYPPADWQLAAGHDDTGTPIAGGQELAPWSAAGGLFSTVEDLQKILATILRRGVNPQGRFLSEAMILDMCNEGLGVMVRGKRNRRHFRHGGDNRGFRALLLGFPHSGKGAVLLFNGRSNDGIMLRERLGRMLMDTV